MIDICRDNPTASLCGCIADTLGADYRGKVKTSVSGEECVPWAWNKNRNFTFPDDTVDEKFDYCRNPNNNSIGPWCYTMEDEYDYYSDEIGERCAIPLCGLSLTDQIYNL